MDQPIVPAPDYLCAIETKHKRYDQGRWHITAAIMAFGFVFIHPFEDGNGRIHRYLFHHVLAEKGFTLTLTV